MTEATQTAGAIAGTVTLGLACARQVIRKPLRQTVLLAVAKWCMVEWVGLEAQRVAKERARSKGVELV